MLFRGQRVVIPEIQQPYVLQELHYSDLVITKIKQLALRYMYWKNIDKDIENLVHSCRSCALVKSNRTKAQLHPWKEPEGNWQRILIDFSGPCQNNFFLVVMDAKSK